jgi:hypothetical protein
LQVGAASTLPAQRGEWPEGGRDGPAGPDKTGDLQVGHFDSPGDGGGVRPESDDRWAIVVRNAFPLWGEQAGRCSHYRLNVRLTSDSDWLANFSAGSNRAHVWTSHGPR